MQQSHVIASWSMCCNEKMELLENEIFALDGV
ncbi:hypothetical protein C806_01203 [Lachnospiraceae bacterium 3-1]|nr:hypothetical protein C806_01203 [Lachnospiraceae bacterium 3-1]